MTRVLVAALIIKRKLVVPDDPKELYELSLDDYVKNGKFKIEYTSSLRILDKAAVNTGQTGPWMLCPVTQVEETKQMMKMVPVLAVTLIPSAMLAQGGTLFIKQGSHLIRSMGPHFEIPPECLSAFGTISMLASLVVYDRYFVPAVRRFTKKPRGLTLLQRMGIGLMMQIIIMIIASLTESKR